MAAAHDDDKPYDDINITPLLDLAFVLLIIFILMTTAAVQGIKVDLPKASASASLSEQKVKAITVSDSGRCIWMRFRSHCLNWRTGCARRGRSPPNSRSLSKGMRVCSTARS